MCLGPGEQGSLLSILTLIKFLAQEAGGNRVKQARIGSGKLVLRLALQEVGLSMPRDISERQFPPLNNLRKERAYGLI